MRFRTAIALLTCVLITGACLGQDLQADGSQYLENQKLDARRSERIESYFAGRIAEIRYRVEREIRRLEVAENHRPSCINPSISTNFVQAVLRINGLSCPLTSNSTEQIAKSLCKVADEKSDLIAKMEFEAARLERQMRAAIRKAELRPESSQQVQPTIQLPRGTITGIVYSADKPSVLIDGQFLHEGDTINGTLIVKIYPDRVALGKGEKLWLQTVGQNPPQ